MKRIDLTRKDLKIMILILFSELTLMSSLGLLQKKHRYTKKWREVEASLDPLVDKIHEVGKFLDYCFNNSSGIRENELNEAKVLITEFLVILENLEESYVKSEVEKIFLKIQKLGAKK